jgi:hypothetical protein
MMTSRRLQSREGSLSLLYPTIRPRLTGLSLRSQLDLSLFGNTATRQSAQSLFQL